MNWIDIAFGCISCISVIVAAKAAIASAKAAKKTYEMAKLANDRENRLCNAANLAMELSADKNTNDSYTLTIYNDGNAYADDLEITSDTLKFNEYYEVGEYISTKYSIGLLRKGCNCVISVKTDDFPGLPFYVTAQWRDDFKEKNEKKFCVWKGNND